MWDPIATDGKIVGKADFLGAYYFKQLIAEYNRHNATITCIEDESPGFRFIDLERSDNGTTQRIMIKKELEQIICNDILHLTPDTPLVGQTVKAYYHRDSLRGFEASRG